MGRLVSFVIGFAALNGSSVRFIHILRVPLSGLRNPMYFPSGESWAPLISGSPKNRSRSRTGDCCANNMTVPPHDTKKRVNAESRMSEPLKFILCRFAECGQALFRFRRSYISECGQEPGPQGAVP